MNNAEVYSFHRVIINTPVQVSLLIPMLECRSAPLSRAILAEVERALNARRSADL
jgi:hypothetical protein